MPRAARSVLVDCPMHVVQHECDHLDGILYPQRMIDLSKLVFASELKYSSGDG